MRRPINPKFASILFDSCAFDPKYSPEDRASAEIYRMFAEGKKMILTIAHSTQKEIDHPSTPAWIKKAANAVLFTYPVTLNSDEQTRKAKIFAILTGNGNPEKYRQDAEHVFEASKYGPYFVTTDERIIRKRGELAQVCAAVIVKPSELLEIIRSYGDVCRSSASVGAFELIS